MTTVQVANTDSNTVMVGLRVQLGSQDLARVPGSLEVFGRSTHVILARSGVTGRIYQQGRFREF